jgi:hypothetical protein
MAVEVGAAGGRERGHVGVGLPARHGRVVVRGVGLIRKLAAKSQTEADVSELFLPESMPLHA